MSNSVKEVMDNVYNQSAIKSNSTSGTSSLDKDSFLQLLVTQMKYQDPLNPSTDTQFVAQLATFSQLEQMQNLNQTYSNSQAFGLVGMNVIVKTSDSSGNVSYKSGTVDYVVMANGTAKLSIDKNLYTLDQLEQVIDSTYLIKQGLPYLTKEVKETFDKAEPKDITFEVNLGKGETVATYVAIILDGKAVDSSKVKLKDNKVTISKDAFADLENGVYKPTLIFDDPLYTTVSGQITITVKGEAAEEPDPDPEEDSETGDETGSDHGEDSGDTV